jgi:phosphomannomutase
MNRRKFITTTGTGIMATLASLPAWSGSSAYDDAALLRLKRIPDDLAQSVMERCSDPALWAGISEGPWGEQRNLKLWWACLSGTRELPMVTHDPENPGAGLRIVAAGEGNHRAAGLLMRPSRTEPVFRLMAEVARRPEESPEAGDVRMHELLRRFRAQVIAAVKELDPGAIAP